jgi:maltose O-acetyltransferase
MGSPPDDPRSQRERMLAGDLYDAVDAELAAERAHAANLAHLFNTGDPLDQARLQALLCELLGSFGEGAQVVTPLHCDYGYQVHIGAGTFVNAGAVFLDVATITLADHVQVGPNVQFLTPTHPVEPSLRRTGREAAQPIAVASNVWLGGGAILLPGVSIGENTVVGAGAVVTKSLPANVVAVGNPARVIRTLYMRSLVPEPQDSSGFIAIRSDGAARRDGACGGRAKAHSTAAAISTPPAPQNEMPSPTP